MAGDGGAASISRAMARQRGRGRGRFRRERGCGDISLVAGAGGASGNGAAGAGGSVSNPSSLLTAGGKTLVPAISADTRLLVAGGTAARRRMPCRPATGGAGGAVSNLSLTLIAARFQVERRRRRLGRRRCGRQRRLPRQVATIAKEEISTWLPETAARPWARPETAARAAPLRASPTISCSTRSWKW